KPVYDYLKEKGIFTTKTVWCFPSRGKYSGQSLSDIEYREWILDLKKNGFEIGLHNVGDGNFSRDEIAAGIDLFEKVLGHAPDIHCNHVSNIDNLYWWDRRFVFPFKQLY